MLNDCTHTSAWWKQMKPCLCCGAIYSDEEAEALTPKHERRFTREQEELIERLEGGEDEPK